MAAKCKVLDFFADEGDSCALTVLVNGVRFHIIADAEKLKMKSAADASVQNEYDLLIRRVRKCQEQNEYPDQEAQEKKPPEEEVNTRTSQDSGYSDSNDDCPPESEEIDDTDSGVETEEPDKKKKHFTRSGGSNGPQVDSASGSPETSLQNWLLSPFSSTFDELAPSSGAPHRPSLQSWYEADTHFFELGISNGDLQPVELESTSDFEKRMQDLIPKMPLPKYLRDKDIPWHRAKDVVVISESNDPDPWHPSRVEVDGKTYFLKMVDPTQPQPTKREVKILHRLGELGLHDKMRVPKIEGLVGFENSHTEIMGFLQTEISEPTPLTNMLNEDVPQQKRKRWAKEAERIKALLHENGIIWGDSKADNFMVDKEDNLWIIDFGGSYTEGWVDPELNETVEGDNMGLERIVNALHDPVANTCDPGQDEAVKENSSANPKRKREPEANDEGSAEPADRQKKSRHKN